MRKNIESVTVIGSGIMGSRIACHFAGVGVSVLLLDIVPNELTEEEKAKGLTLQSKAVRNRIVNTALANTLKANPSPIYNKDFASRIRTGNIDDDLPEIAKTDWIIEVVAERLDIKQSVFEKIEKYRKPGTLITTNTSGIPMHILVEGRSDDFKKYFCGTHFFNPPRYLRLLEIIPSPFTDPEVIDFLMNYGDLYLGKTTVHCKDTPAFIANRIGVYAIMALFHLVEKMGLTIDEVEKLTGPALGRPKSATFRTCDVVGLDTLVHVAKGVYDNCPDDTERDLFTLPSFISKMYENKWWGDKTNQGFFKKVKSESGKSEILVLNLKTLVYETRTKPKFATLETTKGIDNLRDRIKIFASGKDKAGEFYRAAFFGLFHYVADRIPEISDEIYRIDAAMTSGFAWELGPFETWDCLGIKESVSMMETAGQKPANWVYDMLKAGFTSFYKIEGGKKLCYDIPSKSYKAIPGTSAFTILDNLRGEKTVWKNAGASLIDIGDGVLNLEFHTKMNAIGAEIMQGLNTGIDMAEKGFRGLVIGNDAANFSAGANLALVLAYAVEQEFDEIDFAVRQFQNMTMRIKYAGVPVVLAPHGLTLGGGCEMCMHAALVEAAAETYIGLVEVGVGLIPAGGGTKEMTLRASDEFKEGEIMLPVLRERFLTIAMAKTATAAHEAFGYGYFRQGKDKITINQNRLISNAKSAVLELADAGYVKPIPRKDIKVLGRSGLGMIYAGTSNMRAGNYISDHDLLISRKLGWVMCGGDLTAPTLVSEQYLLDLEREAFLSLCGEKKTLERIQSILTTGKPLRN